MSRLPLWVLALVLAAAPFAAADSIPLTSSEFGNTAVATASLTQLGPNQVLVTIDATSGFGLKVNGGSVFLNSTLGLSAASISNLTIVAGDDTFTGLSIGQFQSGKHVSELGIFAYELHNLKGGPPGITSASQISFVVTAPGLTAQQLLNSNSSYQIGVRFCDGRGMHCDDDDDFAAGGGKSIAAVPEPGTLTLFGTGLLGVLGLVRRKFGV